MDRAEYLSLLEASVATNPAPEAGGELQKRAGLGYSGIPLGGDKILAWDGPEDLPKPTNMGDIDSLVAKITKKKYGEDLTKHEATDEFGQSPANILEDDLVVNEMADDEFEDVSYSANLNEVESQILSRLIGEMKALDESYDDLNEDFDEYYDDEYDDVDNE